MADDYADLLTQQAAQARRQKLIDALGAAGQAPITASNGTDRILQALAKIGGGFLGRNQQEALDQDRSTTQANYGTALRTQMGQYMDLMQGKPEMPAAVIPGQSTGPMGPPSPAMPGDTRAAVVSALGSRFPEMQALGKEGLSALGKVDAPEKFGAPVAGTDAQGRSVFLAHGDRGTVRPVDGFAPPAEKPVVVNNQLVNPTAPGGPKVIFDGADKLNQPEKIDGDLYQRDPRTNKLTKLDNAPKVNVSTNVKGPSINMDTGQKFGYKEAFELGAKNVSALGQQATSAVDLMSKLDQMEKLTQAGTVSGPTAPGAIALGQLAAAAGIPFDATKINNSQVFDSIAKEATQKLIGGYGGNRGITATEAEQIAKVTPQLANSPEARKTLTTILRRAAQRQVDNYKKANDSYNKALRNQDPTLFDLGPTMLPTDTPVAPVPGQTSPAAPIVKGW